MKIYKLVLFMIFPMISFAKTEIEFGTNSKISKSDQELVQKELENNCLLAAQLSKSITLTDEKVSESQFFFDDLI